VFMLMIVKNIFVTAYLYGVASEATKKVSTTVNETASTLKKTMEEKVLLLSIMYLFYNYLYI